MPTRPRRDEPRETPEPLGGSSQHGGSQTKTLKGDAELEQHARERELEDPQISPDEEQVLRREREHERRRST